MNTSKETMIDKECRVAWAIVAQVLSDIVATYTENRDASAIASLIRNTDSTADVEEVIDSLEAIGLFYKQSLKNPPKETGT